jgi:low temperature requirement protein LtrA
MSQASSRGKLLRLQGGTKSVTAVELFFDLVFVFAIAQLSHSLLENLTIFGALRTLLLFIAVWWVWIFTTWVTNWLDTNHVAVRLMLFGLMVAGLVLSTSLPEAFGERGMQFALAYVTMQVGRSLFMLYALSGQDSANLWNFRRITVWLALAAVFWIAGGLASGDGRWMLWTAALAIEFIAPLTGFRVPGLGKSTTSDWDVEARHMSERCGLFVIIALGEIITLTGATFARTHWEAPKVEVFLLSVVTCIAMWWIYFNIGAERATRRFAASDDPGRIAHIAYTYIHLPIIAGIVAAAAGTELLLEHPADTLSHHTVPVLTAAMSLFLFGEFLFKKSTAGRWPPSHMAGLAAVAALAVFGDRLSPVQFAAASAALLVTVAAWESISLRNLAFAD